MNIRSPEDLRGHAGLIAHSFAFIGGGSTAPQRNLTQELEQTLAGYQNTAGGFLGLNQQYQPLYDQLNLGSLSTTQQGYTDANGVYHPGTTGLGQAANTSNRGAALGDLSTFGAPTTSSLLSSNPFLADALGGMSAQANKGPSSLLSMLNSQANSQLALGGALSPQDTRTLNQSALADFAGAGLNHGNSGIVNQLFTRDAATRARQQQAQQFAGNVQGLNTTQDQTLNSLLGNYANTASSSITNPLLQLLGFGNLNPGYSGGSTSGSGAISNANELFPTSNSYINDIYSSNQNATASQNIANQNNSTALTAAGIGLIGSLFSDRRLKKKVKTEGKTASGIPIKSWEYKTDEQGRRFVGAMAQDVEKVFPRAVATDPISGLKAVNYDKTDVPFGLVQELLAA